MSTQVTFNTPGTYRWTCPDGVTSVDVEAKGGDASDGTPGETIRATIPVTPRTTYDVAVAGGCISLSAGVTYEGAVTTGAGGGGGGAGPVAGGGNGSRGVPLPGYLTVTYDEPEA